MRALWACVLVLAAALATAAEPPHARTAPAVHAAARTPSAKKPAPLPARGGKAPAAPRLAAPVSPGRSTVPGKAAAGAHAGIRPAAPKSASTPRPAKNAPATLGGPAKYDAKKGAMLGGTMMPHKP
jgi:hypothetical protein